MQARKKADELYQHAIRVHGLHRAKEESLNSAIAIYSLVPVHDKKFWDEVIKHLKT
jgi:hypothetical protein